MLAGFLRNLTSSFWSIHLPSYALEKPKSNQNTKRTVAGNSYILFVGVGPMSNMFSRKNVFHKKKLTVNSPLKIQMFGSWGYVLLKTIPFLMGIHLLIFMGGGHVPRPRLDPDNARVALKLPHRFWYYLLHSDAERWRGCEGRF